ncbi:hypothetical protein ABT336_26500 [Micromonospora sp. NPDC000207]|uniref:hypothetical protein n=1 Tax=Micromonospora sp. NPDC000207 TaxID=3154246 RepID=UPI003318C143
MARLPWLLMAFAVTVCWTPFGLIVTLVMVDAASYEGYRPELTELTTAATVLAVATGSALGLAYALRAPCVRGIHSKFVHVLPAMAAAVAAGALVLATNEFVYSYVIPIGARGGIGSWATALSAAVLAIVLELLIEQPQSEETPSEVLPAPRPGSIGRRLLLAVVVGLVGVTVVPEFVRIGAELSTVRFYSEGAVNIESGQATRVSVQSGSSAIYAHSYVGVTVDDCRLADEDGGNLPLRSTSVRFTDNNDSIVTMLVGTFYSPTDQLLTLVCEGDSSSGYFVSGVPDIRGPLGNLIYGSVFPMVGFGAFPGVLIAVVVVARRWRLMRRRTQP